MKHSCSHCKHEEDQIVVEFVGLPTSPRKVGRGEWEILVPVMDVGHKPVFSESKDADLASHKLFALVYERDRPLDNSGLRWQFRFRGVKEL